MIFIAETKRIAHCAYKYNSR